MKQSGVFWFVFALVLTAMAASTTTTSLDKWVDAEMRTRHLPGMAVGVYRYGKPLAIVTKGFADLEDKVPVRRETQFSICSITKQFTATAVLILCEEGKMRLDDGISKFVDGVPASWSG